jgi:S-adenosylmethionine:tRNA ribosyltransferase-isomerase
MIDEKLTEFETLDIDPLIAEKPAPERDKSRLIVLNRNDKTITHTFFYEIVNYFRPGDCLVLNESKVIKSRIFYYEDNLQKGDILLVQKYDEEGKKWLSLSRKLKPNKRYYIDGGALIEKIDRYENFYLIEFDKVIDFEYLSKYGKVPLPPYIIRKRKEKNMDNITPEDELRYQTVYASVYGSIAAPTAGFHFTPTIIEKLKDKKVHITKIVLHIGYGTFKMVDKKPSEFKMPPEKCYVSTQTAELINNTKKIGGRIFVVGTSVMRTLEKMSNENGIVLSGNGESDIFIKPGWKFKVADCFITNLHVPNSPPLYMTAAFASRDFLFKAYKEAVEKKYRFYSYGDAMLII